MFAHSNGFAGVLTDWYFIFSCWNVSLCLHWMPAGTVPSIRITVILDSYVWHKGNDEKLFYKKSGKNKLN